MANSFRVSSALFQKLQDLGISPGPVLRRAGLPATTAAEEKVFVSTGQLFAMYEAVADLSGDPAIGLKLWSSGQLERYDPVAIAALCTRSLSDALKRMAQYKQLTCPEKIEVQRQGEECSVRFVWLLAEVNEPQALVDLCLAWVAGIASRGSGGELHPKRVELRHSPGQRELYEAHFQCPVRFNAPANVLVFHDSDLNKPFLTHNPDLLAMVAPQLDEELRRQRHGKTLSEQVKGSLKSMLAGQKPSLEAVARDLGLSTRTLQRRLLAEKLTFQQLVRESRRELAQHYLLHSSLELNETAYLLGYEDANSFFRAFHDWEGITPGEWRSSRTVPAA